MGSLFLQVSSINRVLRNQTTDTQKSHMGPSAMYDKFGLLNSLSGVLFPMMTASLHIIPYMLLHVFCMVLWWFVMLAYFELA